MRCVVFFDHLKYVCLCDEICSQQASIAPLHYDLLIESVKRTVFHFAVIAMSDTVITVPKYQISYLN